MKKAQKEHAVAEVTYEQRVAEKRKMVEMAQITNQMHLEQSKAQADSTYYSAMKKAEAGKLLHTDVYLQMKRVEGMTSNAKFIYGKSIPKSIGHGVLNDIAGENTT